MKATVVLLPLLSITSLLFFVAPDTQRSQLAYAYRITNACLQVSQVRPSLHLSPLLSHLLFTYSSSSTHTRTSISLELFVTYEYVRTHER